MGNIAARVVMVRGGVSVVIRTLEVADAAGLAVLDGESVLENSGGELRDEPPTVEDRAKRIAEHLENPYLDRRPIRRPQEAEGQVEIVPLPDLVVGEIENRFVG